MHGEAIAENRWVGFGRGGWSPQSLGGAAAITLALFVALPYLERLTPPTEGPRRLVVVDSTVLPPPVELPAKTPASERRALEPEIVQAVRQLPMSLTVDLDMSIDEWLGTADWSIPLGGLAVDAAVFGLSDLDSAPRPLWQAPPQYPVSARWQRREGWVLLDLVVDTDGRTRDIRVAASAPGGVFDEAACRAASGWRFEPGRIGGRAVAVRVRQKVVFELE